MPEFSTFTNRLLKNARHLRKWARRQGITCYRVYDADVPEFPLAVDVYEDCVHMAEYERKHHLADDERVLWRSGCRQSVQEVFEVRPEKVFYKERRPQKGTAQYEKVAERRHEIEAHENGLRFWVNLSDYLDTGLFLDHRTTRQLFREKAEGKKVLNLFAYTGSFTVYAAAGGAASSLTIDLSNTYLEWAQRNLELNGLGGPQHRFLRADILQWLDQRPDEQFDLIILDPPTFSNSKKMTGILDVQRDHAHLINRVLARTSPGGTLLFSNNYRRFKLDEDAIQGADIRDISARTVPEDFRNKKIHACFEITRKLSWQQGT